MKHIVKWVAVLLCLVVVLGGARWSWAQPQVKTAEKSRFERFHESFGAPQIRPTQGDKVTQMTKQRRIIVNDDGEAD